MADHFYLVLSRPPEGLPEGAYDAWYENHCSELLKRVEGFVSSERFHLDFQKGSPGAIPYTYLTLYKVEGDFETAMQSLKAAVDSGELTFPDWYSGIVSGGWECTSTGSVLRK